MSESVISSRLLCMERVNLRGRNKTHIQLRLVLCTYPVVDSVDVRHRPPTSGKISYNFNFELLGDWWIVEGVFIMNWPSRSVGNFEVEGLLWMFNVLYVVIISFIFTLCCNKTRLTKKENDLLSCRSLRL